MPTRSNVQLAALHLLAAALALTLSTGCKTLARWSKPVDRDGDGLADSDDHCAAVAEDFDGFDDGDGCPDLDNDGDGVVDDHDGCPSEPEDTNGFQDDDGCPEADNDGDGDGIIDSLDRCVMEAEDTDGVDDGDGCPEG